MARLALRVSKTASKNVGLQVEGQWIGTNWANAMLASQALSTTGEAVPPARVYALSVLDAAFRQVVDRWMNSHQPDALAFKNGFVRDAHANAFFEDFASDNPWEVVFQQLITRNKAAVDMHALVATHSPAALLLERAKGRLEDAPGIKGKPLIDVLEEPLQRFTSLDEQVRFVLAEWAEFLDDDLKLLILRSSDYLKEVWTWSPPGPAGPAQPYTFESSSTYVHQERFSEDREWMPSVVLIAKNIYVWLHQLSVTYKRDIQRLDQIPDEELAILQKRGITGLWMIGLWERSEASQRIKQLCGNPDAVASAYSLYDYAIAHALGGDDAWANLSQRAWSFGIRLAADMVPNHMGIVSAWTKEHPEWFLSLPHSPYPNYTFNGENLSDSGDFTIQLEDRYYDKTDAAVVFRHIDNRNGTTRYIYHGNDGTSMPWNDTAQLDYLNPDAREAVIQAILSVARKFPIIRFDAAMTLVRKHVQRLWYPEPGHGGAIPSRSHYGISQAEFDARLPKEFWQEVVDRIQTEAPDTLLLAEAFWMLEGYFVRTLGMHRVYNSAFMNMLRDEDNAGYRKLMKNTLAFDPQVLKRYVNFMNNPDEDTAVHQFGKGDKYFGVAILMLTMPGLPMLGHGQVEGFSEKYGMDFRRPLLHETPDVGLVNHHERVLFPLMHQRRLFAEVDNFALYDVFNTHGSVDENVFAYSNMRDGARALVVYHNVYADSTGWVRTAVGEVGGTIGDHLQMPRDSVARFKDVVTGKWYLRETNRLIEQGFFVQLHAYSSHVFMEWAFETSADWFLLCHHMNGSGTTDFRDVWLACHYGTLRAAVLAAIETPEPGETLIATLVAELAEKTPITNTKELTTHLLEHWPESPQARLVVLLDAVDPVNPLQLLDLMGLDNLVDHGQLVRAVLAVTPELDPSDWLKSECVQTALGVHLYDGTRYFKSELADDFVAHFGELFIARFEEHNFAPEDVQKAMDDLNEAFSLAAFNFDRVDLNHVL